MKNSNNFTPSPQKFSIIKYSLIILTTLSLLLLSGCTKSPTTSLENPDLRCKKLPNSVKSSEKDFWNFAYKEIPTVTYSEATSGDYNDSYVCLDGVILQNFIDLLIAFPDSDSYVDDDFMVDKTIGSSYIYDEEIDSGDSVKICVYVDSDGAVFYNLEAIQPIKETFDINIPEYMKKRNEKLDIDAHKENAASTTTAEIPSPVPSPTPSPADQNATSSKRIPYSLKFGELLDANPNGGTNMNTLVIKAKIEPNLTNQMTITQNYQNVIHMVKDGDYTQYDAISYWAVADMADGSEGKVISFTIDKSCIEAIANGTIATGDTLEEHLTDLWILPSLQEN